MLRQFRCFNQATFAFSPGLNILLGPNGSGKTSVLEAIFFTCLTRSFRTPHDSEAIMRDKDHAVIKSEWTDFGKVRVTLVRNFGKRVFLNDVLEEKYSDWIGKLPIVILSPDDAELINGTPQIKRQYFDRVFSQISHEYLSTLIRYTKLLKQRNAYLKVKNTRNSFIYDTQLETYDEQMAPLSEKIFFFRQEYFSQLNKALITLFHETDSRKIHVSIEYKSSLKAKDVSYVDTYLSEAKQNIQNEIILKRSFQGAGYDRIDFKRNQQSLKMGASQGEKKMWLICLKLAEGSFIHHYKNIEPLYLFDDLFSDLDIEHTQKLVKNIHHLKEIIITSTDLNDLRQQGVLPESGSFNIINI